VPVDLDAAAAGHQRIPGLYAGLTEHQAAAVIQPDVRLYDWHADDMTASKARVDAEAKIQPRRSTLLDNLRAGKPVVVEWTLARPFLPAELSADRYLRVFPDDRVEPADGLPDQYQP
jgi:hypothetical protein